MVTANKALSKFSLAVTRRTFCYLGHPIVYIDDKSHKLQLRSIYQSYEVQITPLVIYGNKGGHTNIPTSTQK